jgi:hypothetical protein
MMLLTRTHQISKLDLTSSSKEKDGSQHQTGQSTSTSERSTRIFKSFSCSETPTTNFPELVKQLTESGLLNTDTNGAMYETSTKQY